MRKYKLLGLTFLMGLSIGMCSTKSEVKSLNKEKSHEKILTTAEVSTEELTTEEVSTEELTTEEVSTEEILTTKEVSTEEILTTKEVSTEEIPASLTVKTEPVVQVAQPVKGYSYYKIVDTNDNNCESTLDLELQDYLYETCKKYGVEDHYELLLAQMYNESSFNPNAISSTNDYGLMQINVCNHEWLSGELGVTNFLDPYQNIDCGVYMMSDFLHKYSEETALVAYNMGEGKVRQGITSSGYSDKVLGYKEMLVEISEDN